MKLTKVLHTILKHLTLAPADFDSIEKALHDAGHGKAAVRPTDKFYHLNRLMDAEYAEMRGDKYRITDYGLIALRDAELAAGLQFQKDPHAAAPRRPLDFWTDEHYSGAELLPNAGITEDRLAPFKLPSVIAGRRVWPVWPKSYQPEAA